MGSVPRAASSWLVLGASGGVGRGVLSRLSAAQPPRRALALSRHDPPAWAALLAGVEWRRGDLHRDRLLAPIDTVLSAGPLDGLVDWLERERPAGVRRVVALSSTSVHVKAGSIDPDERALAERLAETERRLAAWARAQAARWTVLRPTLIYGGGGDRTLTPLARIAARLGVFALPANARGARQPVHADDVAQAMLAAADAPAAYDRAYDLPGGETLRYDAMVRRVLAGVPRRVRLLTLPPPLFRALAAVARLLPAFRAASPAVLARMADDLVFDGSAAARDFGYAPRGFAPAPWPAPQA
jgi:nucleoside-diphosphate-sugar epimerase